MVFARVALIQMKNVEDHKLFYSNSLSYFDSIKKLSGALHKKHRENKLLQHNFEQYYSYAYGKLDEYDSTQHTDLNFNFNYL
jgi:hypothetical protein